jgi:putative ABC transport system substrate-binding protein
MTALKAACIFQALLVFVVAESLASDKPGEPRKIAVVNLGATEMVLPQLRGLYDGLEEVGYVEGKNLKIHLLRGGNESQARDLLKTTIKQGIEVIATPSSAEASLAKQVTTEVPIVFAPAVDPVGNGLVKSRASPGTNLTGLSYTRDVEDSGKQLSVFKQVVPGLRRVILFYDGRPVARTALAVVSSVVKVAQRLGIQVTQQHAVQSSSEAVEILRNVAPGSSDGVFLICSAVFRGMTPFSDMATSKGLPISGCTASQVAEEGALMTYTPDIYYLGYRGAWYVDRILKGAKPAQLRVETPTRFELVINITNARKIGLTVPAETLLLADKVFQ